MRIEKGLLTTTLAVCAAGLGACSSGSSTDESIGYLSLGVSDAPLHDAEKVCIAFDSVGLYGAAGGPVEIDLGGVQNVNLLEFQGANAWPMLFEEPLPAGRYEQMRLGIIAPRGVSGGVGDNPMSAECVGEESYITFEDGTFHNLYMPSGAESGYKLNGEVIITANQVADFTIEVDLMQSLATPPGLDPYMVFRPTAKLVNNLEAGILIGNVAMELATAVDADSGEACEPAVYVFDDGVEPNAFDPEVEDPSDSIASAMVKPVANGDATNAYAYSIGFLEAGSYEVAFSCDGESFEPVAGKAAEIVAGEVTEVDFP